MKPTNAKESGCDPISSNCVIWQGPDIECINLCKGDSVSTVVAKLAERLCELIDTFNLDNFDLSCLNLGDCPPEDFQALIQLLIERICALEGINPDGTPTGPDGCPDCVVNIASCFYFTNPQGDQETTMQLTDYVTAIGNEICNILSAINTINQTLENHENRIQALEQAEPVAYQLPRVTPVCVLPATPVGIDVLLVELERRFCELQGATGEPMAIYTAIQKQPAGLNNDRRLGGSGNMDSIEGWESEITDQSKSVANLWLTVADLRAAMKNMQATLPGVCDEVDVTMTAQLPDPNTLKLFFNGSIPSGFGECNSAGTRVTIKDSEGGQLIITVPVVSNLNNAVGYQIDLLTTPINGSSDLNITADLCLTDDEAVQCQSCLQYTVLNQTQCPTVNLVPGQTTVQYDFGWTGGAASFKIDLYDTSGTVLLQTQNTSVQGPQGVAGTFSNLQPGTVYKVKVTVTAGTAVSECPFTSTTTLTAPCIPPTGVASGPIQIT